MKTKTTFSKEKLLYTVVRLHNNAKAWDWGAAFSKAREYRLSNPDADEAMVARYLVESYVDKSDIVRMVRQSPTAIISALAEVVKMPSNQAVSNAVPSSDWDYRAMAQSDLETQHKSLRQKAVYLGEMLGRDLVAQGCGVSAPTVSKWIKGQTTKAQSSNRRQLDCLYWITRYLHRLVGSCRAKLWIGSENLLLKECPVAAIGASRYTQTIEAARSFAKSVALSVAG